MNTKTLEGKTALITGASKGLGQAMALALASAGARIALVSRNLELLNETAAAVRKRGAEAAVFQIDVADETQVRRLESVLAGEFGKVQILINNAGMNLRKPVTDFTLAEWRQVMDTNLTSVFLMCRSFVPQMRGQGYGRILNLTSIMSHVALPGRTAYAASKAALLGFTRALALELASEKITVNGISPGPIATEMNTPLMQDPEVNQQFISRIPLGRWGKVEEVGQLALISAPRTRASSLERTS
jgi:NAD(P)-dependent dehydrogenase (short-subunit alcohol dehydrogenase family)